MWYNCINFRVIKYLLFCIQGCFNSLCGIQTENFGSIEFGFKEIIIGFVTLIVIIIIVFLICFFIDYFITKVKLNYFKW